MTPVAQKTDKPPKKGSLVCETHLVENKKDRVPGQRTGPVRSLMAKGTSATVAVPVPASPTERALGHCPKSGGLPTVTSAIIGFFMVWSF